MLQRLNRSNLILFPLHLYLWNNDQRVTNLSSIRISLLPLLTYSYACFARGGLYNKLEISWLRLRKYPHYVWTSVAEFRVTYKYQSRIVFLDGVSGMILLYMFYLPLVILMELYLHYCSFSLFRGTFLRVCWCSRFPSKHTSWKCELWLRVKRECYLKKYMCLGQSNNFLPYHISPTKPGRNSTLGIAWRSGSPSCALCSTLAPLSPSPRAGEPNEARFSWRLWWELWWEPFLCCWLVLWVTLPGGQAGLELRWVWLSGLSSSQGIAGLCSASVAPTVPALCYGQRNRLELVFVHSRALLAGQRCKFYMS